MKPPEGDHGTTPTVAIAILLLLASIALAVVVIWLDWGSISDMIIWGWYAPVAFIGGLWMLRAALKTRRRGKDQTSREARD